MFTPPPKNVVKLQSRGTSTLAFMISTFNHYRNTQVFGVDSSQGLLRWVDHLPPFIMKNYAQQNNATNQNKRHHGSTPPDGAHVINQRTVPLRVLLPRNWLRVRQNLRNPRATGFISIGFITIFPFMAITERHANTATGGGRGGDSSHLPYLVKKIGLASFTGSGLLSANGHRRA